ncbi:MAG: hypothetical protein OHK006_18670 [Thermodesulfovibrionales bacterium]
MRTHHDQSRELLRCPICETLLQHERGFTCPRCRRRPLCVKHRAPGRKECFGCAQEILQKELAGLYAQEKSLKAFEHLMQFLFIVFSILFAAGRFDTEGILRPYLDNPIGDNLLFFGIVAAAGYVISLIILYNQRQNIRNAESQVRTFSMRRA